MGQKIIPISLRLNKKENWNSKWIVPQKNYSNLLHLELEIKNYFENIFNYKNLKLIKIHTVKTSNNINVYIYVQKNSKKFYKLPYNKIITHLNSYYKNHNIKLFVKSVHLNDLKKLRKSLNRIFLFIKKNNRITKDIKKMVYNFSYAFYTKNINIISYYIKQTLEKKKNT